MAKEYIEQRDGNYYVAGTRISLDSIFSAWKRSTVPLPTTWQTKPTLMPTSSAKARNGRKERATPSHFLLICASDSCAPAKRCTPRIRREGSISGGRRPQPGHCERCHAPRALSRLPHGFDGWIASPERHRGSGACGSAPTRARFT